MLSIFRGSCLHSRRDDVPRPASCRPRRGARDDPGERAARPRLSAEARSAEALMSGARLEIERLKLLLAKARREQYGRPPSAARRLIAQLELQLAELEETAAEDETAAEIAASGDEPARSSAGTSGANPPAGRLPEHLPRERIVVPAPRPAAAAAAAGSPRSARTSPRRSMSCRAAGS